MTIHPTDLRLDQPDRFAPIAALAAIGAMLLAGVAQMTFADPDLYHEMALFREAVRLGRFPRIDLFAYTPTVTPVVHHEWGTGAILYSLATYTGAAGILIARYVVIAVLVWLVIRCARLAGATPGVMCALAPVAIFLAWSGTTTIRAQLFSMVLFAALLNFLLADRRGKRWWILPWLALYVLWLNLHGGFIAGVAIFGGHILETLLRRRPIGHLVLTMFVMGALVTLNPYGLSYYAYLLRAIPMDRPLISEWQPIWHGPLIGQIVFLVSLCVVAYAAYRAGWRRMPGILVVLLAAIAAVRHQRHVTLYAIAWMSYVSAFVQPTPLGDWLSRLWARQGRRATAVWTAVTAVFSIVFIIAQPWRLTVPANSDDRRPPAMPLYPVGAVEYLRSCDFRGNLMTPFEVGAFVSWRLYPDVKVSLDGRYELAYVPGAVAEHHVVYTAGEGWKDVLAKYPTDAILVPAESPLSDKLPAAETWSMRYRDDAFEVYTRSGLELPPLDRRGTVLRGEFP